MSALKDAHEEEMQQLLSETSAKIQQYRLKIGNELDLRRLEVLKLSCSYFAENCRPHVILTLMLNGSCNFCWS